jgi:hypothetical protein
MHTNSLTSISDEFMQNEKEHLLSSIASVEEKLNESYDVKCPGGRQLACGIASELTKHYLEYDQIDQPNETYVTRITKVWELQAAALGLDASKMLENFYGTRHSPEETLQCFQHTFCITKHNDQFFLIDTTFCQFVDSQLNILETVQHGENNTGYTLANPVAKELYDDGYIELTVENLSEFLKITSDKSQHVHIPENPDVQKVLAAVFYENPDFTKEELDEYCFKGNPLRTP